MNLNYGTMEEQSARSLFGIIKSKNQDIYTAGYYPKGTQVAFEVNYIGPKGNQMRAINVHSLNNALELLTYNVEATYFPDINQSNKEQKKYKKIIQFLLDNNSSEENLSPTAKKGLTYYYK